MCGIVGLLVKTPALRERLGDSDGADADRHDRARPGLGGPRGVRQAGRCEPAQAEPVCGLYEEGADFAWQPLVQALNAAMDVTARVDAERQSRQC